VDRARGDDERPRQVDRASGGDEEQAGRRPDSRASRAASVQGRVGRTASLQVASGRRVAQAVAWR